jgi:hypothetical protein
VGTKKEGIVAYFSGTLRDVGRGTYKEIKALLTELGTPKSCITVKRRLRLDVLYSVNLEERGEEDGGQARQAYDQALALVGDKGCVVIRIPAGTGQATEFAPPSPEDIAAFSRAVEDGI